MTEKELRKEIIKACLYLKKTGLIARTWGNVSARLNDEEFIITPTGLDYEKMKPEDLVVVKIQDCSYADGLRKPSSEKLVHASAYKLRDDVKFIVHTHQFYASAICADELSIALSDGSFVPCAAYGLPSTKKLQRNCERVFEKFTNSTMFLMAKHGAIILGSKSMKDTLDDAERLEKECKTKFDRRVRLYDIPENAEPYLDDYAQLFPLQSIEDEDAIKLVKEKNAAARAYAINSKPLNKLDAKLQHFVYLKKYSKLKEK